MNLFEKTIEQLCKRSQKFRAKLKKLNYNHNKTREIKLILENFTTDGKPFREINYCNVTKWAFQLAQR